MYTSTETDFSYCLKIAMSEEGISTTPANQYFVENNRLYSKFGEIFFTTDCRCLFVCVACDQDFEFFDEFIEHIGVDHDFQDVFQSSEAKRLVCISNVVDERSKSDELELIEEETKDLIEYREEEIKVEACNKDDDTASQSDTTSIGVNFVQQSTDSPQSTVVVSEPCNKSVRENFQKESFQNEELPKHCKNSPVLGEHICDMCGKKFASENNLVRHKWRHSSQTKWSCPTCGKVTTTKDGMILHVRRNHTGEKPYKCKFCDKTFPSTTQRNLHHGVHTGYKPYVCEKCGKAFKLYTVLRYHMEWHLGIKNYKCDKCDKRFHTTSELTNHQSVHTWERPFPCSGCNLRFKTKRHLARHQEVHSGKLRMCKYCDRGFAHVSTLTSHLRLHQLDASEDVEML